MCLSSTVKQAGKDFTYLIVVLIGLGVTGDMFDLIKTRAGLWIIMVPHTHTHTHTLLAKNNVPSQKWKKKYYYYLFLVWTSEVKIKHRIALLTCR